MVQLTDLELSLDRDTPMPLYQQLRRQLAQLIQTRRLPPGTRLPPRRELAAYLGVNRATVASAYDRLVADGLARARVGQGTFVTGQRGSPAGPARLRWPLSQAMEAVARRPRPTRPTTEHPDPIDFASLVPDERLFPIERFREVLNDVLQREGKQLLQYGPAGGYPPLRDYIAHRLGEQGIATGAEEILIVNGSQQGLDLVFRALVDPGDTVAVESPTYSAVLPVLAQYQARVLEIPMSSRGMDLDHFRTVLERSTVKLLYTMPTFHNPTGITTDLVARQALLELAQQHRLPIIEDDFDSDLRFHGEALAPLKALDQAGLVVYVGTFSKGLFPGLRLGWIVAPAGLVEPLSRTKMFSDYHSSPLTQAGVLEFCRRGYYEEHLRRLIQLYRNKSRRLIEAMRRYFPPEASWTEPQGGYAFWVTLPEGISSEALLSEAARTGVLFTPGSYFFASDQGQRALRLSISRVSLERIEEGVELLGKIMKRMLALSGWKARRGSPAAEPVFHI